MAQVSQVPKFGNWENANNVPYTAYFEKVRSNRSVKMNPNNTPGNSDMLSNNVSPVRVPPFRKQTKAGAQKGQEAVRKKHVHSTSQEVGDLRRPSESLLHHDAANCKVASASPLPCDGSISSNDSPRKAIKQGLVSDSRFDNSLLHPNRQAKVGGKGNGTYSPSWQRKGSTERSNNLAPLMSGTSRLTPVTRGNGAPDHSAAVPKFGDWDETDPASAEGYTHTFNIVREEKLNRNSTLPVSSTQKSSSEGQRQPDNKTSKFCCCFPWSK